MAASRKIPRVSGSRFVGKPVAVAYNRHQCLVTHPRKPGEHCFPVRAKPTSSSKVLGYADELWLEDVSFFVSPSGLRRVKDTGTRDVIAFVVGTGMKPKRPATLKKRGWFDVRFNPFEQGCFYDARSDACLRTAKYAVLRNRGIRAFGAEKGKPVGSQRELNPELVLFTPERETWHGEMGGLNYRPASAEAVAAELHEVRHAFPEAIVIDGSDDWDAPEHMRPELFPELFGTRPLARWHTGASGVSASGLVLSPEEYDRLCSAYRGRFGFHLTAAPGRSSSGSPSSCGCWDGRGFRVYQEHRSPELKRRLMR